VPSLRSTSASANRAAVTASNVCLVHCVYCTFNLIDCVSPCTPIPKCDHLNPETHAHELEAELRKELDRLFEFFDQIDENFGTYSFSLEIIVRKHQRKNAEVLLRETLTGISQVQVVCSCSPSTACQTDRTCQSGQTRRFARSASSPCRFLPARKMRSASAGSSTLICT